MIGKIYKITPNNQNDFYIGSTINMKTRKIKHDTDAKNSKTKLYVKIRECEGYDMTLLYDYEYEEETDLKQEEQRCIDKLKPQLNMIRAYCSEEYEKQYNKEKKSEIVVCECGVKMTKAKLKNHKTRNIHKQSMEELNLYGRLLTKEERFMSEEKVLKRKEWTKNHYQTNRNRILDYSNKYHKDNIEKKKERVICECGKEGLRILINKNIKTIYNVLIFIFWCFLLLTFCIYIHLNSSWLMDYNKWI